MIIVDTRGRPFIFGDNFVSQRTVCVCVCVQMNRKFNAGRTSVIDDN
jgi:hypothetical protein